MLARPLLLAICVILGGLAGFAAWGDKGYKATATIEFFSSAGLVEMVRLEGTTLASRITSEGVIQRAAKSVGQPATDIAANTTANWQPQSSLVNVTAVAASPDEAVARANAVVNATVATLSEEAVQGLDKATANANSLLLDQLPLPDPDAEAARRSQIGSGLGQRQEGLIGQSQSVSIQSPANVATPAGLTKSMTIAIGLAAGLFAGCLIAVLLGSRGLRVGSLGALRRLAPGVQVLTPSQAPQLAGRIVEAGETYFAVLVTRRSSDLAEAFAADMARILSTHGRTVTSIRPPANVDESSAPLLRADAPNNVRSLVGTDVLLVILEARTESAAMLEGRSGFRTVVLMRQHRTPVSDGLSAARAYMHATPVLMLAK
jgi:hypothetical protein